MTVEKAVATLQARLKGPIPKIAVILGSGLGPFADQVQDSVTISYEDLEGFPPAGVAGHAGQIKVGTVGGCPVLVMQGRAHYYEDGNAAAMKTPIMTLKALGIETLLLTNAAGSLRSEAGPGSVMAITDHINMAGVSPLFGVHDNSRFTDLSAAYDADLQAAFAQCAADLGVTLHQGVYAWMSGPQFETLAEIKMLDVLGADAVGMSTVPETILARWQGMKVAALSIITNYAAGMSETALSHEQTIENAAKATEAVQQLLTRYLETQA